MWAILYVIAGISLVLFWKGPNAVWGGVFLGALGSLIWATIVAISGHGFYWSLGKGVVIGVLLGGVAELLGEAGDYVRAATAPGTPPKQRWRLRGVVLAAMAGLVGIVFALLSMRSRQAGTKRVAPLMDEATAPGGQAPAVTPPSNELPAFGEFVYVEELPEAITRVPPDYPEIARASGTEGTVMLQALVGKDGKVKDVRVVKSVPVLDDAAVKAVKQWVFKPALSNNKPVAVWVAVPVRFSLH